MDATSRPPLGAFGLVTQSVRLLFAHFGFLFPLAFVPALLLAIIGWITAPGEPAPMDAMTGPLISGQGVVLLFVGILVDVLVGFVVTGVMCLAAIDAIIGKRHHVGDYLSQTLYHIAPIVALGVALYVFAVVGIVLLIIPGLYILARFLPLVPAIVFENAGWSGLTRAQELTEGYRWPLVGAILLFALLALALAVLLVPFAVLAEAGGGILLVPIEAAAMAIYYALVAIFTALIYARLREIREGVSTADLAASID